MPDFGNAGTRTVTVFNPNVTVNATAGEFLNYTLIASGGMPAFAYACAHRDPISRADQFAGHPKASYGWKLQKTGEVLPSVVAADSSNFDPYTVAMSFLGAVRYDLTINLCNGDGSVKNVVQQISYASNDSTDSCAEDLGVSWT
jgi:hypothetical protein